MMLSHLVYTSAPSLEMSNGELMQIVEQARCSNERAGVTGMLAFAGDAFLQVLDGDEAAVAAIYGRIREDQRHRALVVLGIVKSQTRRFHASPLGFAGLSSFNENLLLRFSGTTRLEPGETSALEALDLLAALALETQ
jgi:hypothetical protein